MGLFELGSNLPLGNLSFETLETEIMSVHCTRFVDDLV